MKDARELEQRYRELERRKEVSLETRVRRGQLGLLIALLVSVLLAAVTAAVDLRRLGTPAGTARAWAEATVFGDCDQHLALSLPVVDEAEQRRLCRALTERSTVARDLSTGTRVTTRLVEQRGRTAVAAASRTGRDAVRVEARLQLRRTDDGWRVLRDPAACALGC